MVIQCLYFLFLTLCITIVAIWRATGLAQNVQSYEASLKQPLIYEEWDPYNAETFTDIISPEEWWTWVDQCFLPFAYQQSSSRAYFAKESGIGEGLGFLEPSSQRINRGAAQFIGRPRFRLVQVDSKEPSTVRPRPYVGNLPVTSSLFGLVGDTGELPSRQPFNSSTGKYQFRFYEEENFFVRRQMIFHSAMQIIPPDGYVIEIPKNLSDAKELFAELQQDPKVNNMNTRAILIEFVSGMRDDSVLIVSQFCLEITSTGLVKPSYRFEPIYMNSFRAERGRVLIILQYFILGMLVWRQIKFILHVCRMRQFYSKRHRDWTKAMSKFRKVRIPHKYCPWLPRVTLSSHRDGVVEMKPVHTPPTFSKFFAKLGLLKMEDFEVAAGDPPEMIFIKMLPKSMSCLYGFSSLQKEQWEKEQKIWRPRGAEHRSSAMARICGRQKTEEHLQV